MDVLKIVLLHILLMLSSIGITRSHGGIPESTRRKIVIVNEDGPFLGLVVPNKYEMEPLLQSRSFVPDAQLPYLDVASESMKPKRTPSTLDVKDSVLEALARKSNSCDDWTKHGWRGVLHLGTAGVTNPNFQLGDVTIPKFWPHTGPWNWQRYGDGPDDELALESNGGYTRKIGYLDFSEYSNVSEKGEAYGSFLSRVWYQPEEIFPVDGVPEVREHAFWLPVNQHYYALSKKLERMKLKRCVNSTTCLPRSPMVVRVRRGCTGNIFLSNVAMKQFLYSKFNITTMDMESAAVALVCRQQKTPFMALRAVSGGGSFQSKDAIAIFTPLASENVVNVLVHFISLLSDAESKANNASNDS